MNEASEMPLLGGDPVTSTLCAASSVVEAGVLERGRDLGLVRPALHKVARDMAGRADRRGLDHARASHRSGTR